HTRTLYSFFDFIFELKPRRAEKFLDNTRVHHKMRILTFQQTPRVLPANIRDLSFEITDTRFSRVVPYDVLQRRILKFDLLGIDSAILAAARDKVLPRDLNFFFFGVARQFEDFHAVPQRRRNRVENIGGSDEEDS